MQFVKITSVKTIDEAYIDTPFIISFRIFQISFPRKTMLDLGLYDKDNDMFLAETKHYLRHIISWRKHEYLYEKGNIYYKINFLDKWLKIASNPPYTRGQHTIQIRAHIR